MKPYAVLDVYPVVPDVALPLRSNGIKTAILSNGNIYMLNLAIGSAKLSNMFDVGISVDKLNLYATPIGLSVGD
jgi:2-haloacid dehalogenase